MSDTIAYLEWSLHVACPACSQSNDIARANHDTENMIARHIFTDQWQRLEQWEVTCEHCNHEFTIDKVVY